MFSRFLGKGSKPDEVPTEQMTRPRGLEVIEDDPDTVWGLWDSALADADSRYVGIAPMSAAKPQMRGQAPAASPAPKETETATEPMPLEDLSPEQRKEKALEAVEIHHPRIAATIRSMWGYKECSVYINKLIMSGGDGMGNARIGFNPSAVDAMMLLTDLHDQQFGVLDIGPVSSFDPTIR
jgi:hypothetical protein